MKIIEAGGEYGKRDIYKLTKSPTIQKLSAHDGEILKVDKYVIYEDSENRDDPIIILSIQSGETVRAVHFHNGWIEFDTNEDYENALNRFENGELKRIINIQG